MTSTCRTVQVHRPAASRRSTAALRLRRLGTLLAASSLLLACSTPLPPQRPLPTGPLVVAPPAAQQAASAASAPASAPVDTSAAPVAEAGPITPAVAARFPPPAEVYRTPGLEAGRDRFTTDGELHSWLLRLERPLDESRGQPAVRLLVAGSSQRGAPIEALLLSKSRDNSAQGLRTGDRPTVMFIGGQHGDEPASTESMLVLAQQLASGPLQGVLRQVNVLIVPRANPDAALRPQRQTVNGIDLNRDHLLLRTPEARALARLVTDYRPIVVVDAHEYPAIGQWARQFGVVRRHDVLVQYAMTPNMAEFVTRASEEWFRLPLLKDLSAARLSAEWYHVLQQEPPGVVAMGGPRPDTSRNVNGLRHAVSLLIETRGSDLGRRNLQRRVHGQVVAAASILRSAAARAGDLQKLRGFVESDISAKACKGTIVVQAAPTPSEYDLTTIDPQTGADRLISVNWQSTLQLRPARTRLRPCGYWLAANQTEAVIRLRQLGLEVLQISEPVALRGESYRVLAAAWRDLPASGAENADDGYAQPVPVDVQAEMIEAEPGSYYVPLTQPLAMLAVAALEPDSPSSYMAHGLIDGAASIARIMVVPLVRLDPLH
ncbi:M14 family metallopeptidase [Piscinibacter sakaiensis]|uniref:M14 family metallopeptidase n=1 Tax=Piscinibacter sakaiensis TaxID=1547922 RepID=UPI003AB032EF